MEKQWPKRGELVIVKVKRVMDYGAVAGLLEYEGKEGFIHISNVTKSWVKNIRSHVSKGEMRVAEVVNVDRDKNSINLSFKDVSDIQIRRKMNLWKRTKRTKRLIKKLAEDMGKNPEKAEEEVVPELEKAYGDPFVVFEEAATYGEETLEQIGVSDEWKEKIYEFAKENITPKEVTIEGQLNIEVETGDGLETIKKALKPITKQENVKIEYISAPKYKLIVRAKDYQEAEDKVSDINKKVKKEIEKVDGEVTFQKSK